MIAAQGACAAYVSTWAEACFKGSCKLLAKLPQVQDSPGRDDPIAPSPETNARSCAAPSFLVSYNCNERTSS